METCWLSHAIDDTNAPVPSDIEMGRSIPKQKYESVSNDTGLPLMRQMHPCVISLNGTRHSETEILKVHQGERHELTIIEMPPY